MGTRWLRPETTTPSIVGGYVLMRSHAVLALWQSYTDGHIELLDVRTALAEVEARHSAAAAWTQSGGKRKARSTDLTHPVDAERLRQLTGCSDARKTRRSLRRLTNAGVSGDVLISRTGTPLPTIPRNLSGVADRPVPVPRRWLRELARSGTSAQIAVSLALLLRGSFYNRGVVRLGGTCSAAWIASVFGLDERTAKSARAELGRRGWVCVAESPVWHRQRYGMTFLLQVPPVVEDAAGVPGSPPRGVVNVPGLPPPKKNKNLPLRGAGNQDRPAGCPFGQAGVPLAATRPEPPSERAPTLTDIRLADLEVPRRTMALFVDAQRRGVIGNATADRLRFFTTVQHARGTGDRPEALMASLARRRCWHYGTQADEDAARRVLAMLDAEPCELPPQRPAMFTAYLARPRPENPVLMPAISQTRMQDLQPIATVLARLVPAVTQPSDR